VRGSARPDIAEVMERIRGFHKSERPGQALLDVSAPPNPDRPHREAPSRRKLNEWSFPEELHGYLDQRIFHLERGWEGRDIADDRIPVVCPHFGIAEHSAFMGGEVEFTEHTSWVHPVVTEWDRLSSLELSENNLWFKILMDSYDYMLGKTGERFVPCLRGLMLPMDLANSLRGNDIFSDIHAFPDETRALLEFCTEASRWFISRQLEKVGQYRGGVMGGGGVWLPGNSIGHLNEDASVMCSPRTYGDFGLEYSARVISEYDHAFIHLHGAGSHAFEPILSNDKLVAVEITNDPGQPRGIELYKEFFGLLEHRAVKLFVTPDEIGRNMDLLKRGKTLLWTHTRSREQAREIIEFARGQLPVDM